MISFVSLVTLISRMPSGLGERNLTCFKKPGVSLVESTAIDLICEGYSFCGSAQVNTVFNSKDTMLDLIFVNDFAVTVDAAIDSLITPDVYHPPLLVSPNDFTPLVDQGSVIGSYYDFKRGDYPNMINYLNSVDWGLHHSRGRPRYCC